jgi:hypothetical protein
MASIALGSKRAEDLLVGALAVLALQGVTTLRVDDRSFHDHFAKALDEFRNEGGEIGQLAALYHRDPVTNTFDELDHAIIRAEQDRLIGLPNPTYSRLQIKMTRRAAERILAEWSANRDVFDRAAEELRRSIER